MFFGVLHLGYGKCDFHFSTIIINNNKRTIISITSAKWWRLWAISIKLMKQLHHNLRTIGQKGGKQRRKSNQNKNIKCERRKLFMLLSFCHSFRQIVEEFASQMCIVMECYVAFTWCTFSDCNYCAFDLVVWFAFAFAFAFVWHLQSSPPFVLEMDLSVLFSSFNYGVVAFLFYGVDSFKIPSYSSLISFPFLIIKSTYIETNWIF